MIIIIHRFLRWESNYKKKKLAKMFCTDWKASVVRHNYWASKDPAFSYFFFLVEVHSNDLQMAPDSNRFIYCCVKLSFFLCRLTTAERRSKQCYTITPSILCVQTEVNGSTLGVIWIGLINNSNKYLCIKYQYGCVFEKFNKYRLFAVVTVWPRCISFLRSEWQVNEVDMYIIHFQGYRIATFRFSSKT